MGSRRVDLYHGYAMPYTFIKKMDENFNTHRTVLLHFINRKLLYFFVNKISVILFSVFILLKRKKKYFFKMLDFSYFKFCTMISKTRIH